MASIAFASTEIVVQQVPSHLDPHPHDSWDAYMPEMAYPMTLVFNDPPNVDPGLSAAPYPHLLPPKPHVESFAQFPIEHVQVPQIPSQETSAKPDSPLDVPQNVPQVVESSVQSADLKTTKKASPPAVDPFAAGYLREVLGDAKWNIFSARLFERRLTGPRRSKKPTSGENGKAETTASLIDFLCKAEAVKEVLRTYVPHPYNPHKTLTHAYTRAPTGRITLSRSTVLALSGWSNTQFSYWARRSEAIGVLAFHDRRLKSVAIALHARLRGAKLTDEVGATEGITGKGLDAIVEEVKVRTGASPFIRGKHSCLDPFTITDVDPQVLVNASVPPWVSPQQGVAVEYQAAVGGYVPAVYSDGTPSSAGIVPVDIPPGTEVASVSGGVQYYMQPPQMGYPTVGTHFQITEPAHYATTHVSPVIEASLSPVAIAPHPSTGDTTHASLSPQPVRPLRKRARTKKVIANVDTMAKEEATSEEQDIVEPHLQHQEGGPTRTRASPRKRKSVGDAVGGETKSPPRKRIKKE